MSQYPPSVHLSNYFESPMHLSRQFLIFTALLPYVIFHIDSAKAQLSNTPVQIEAKTDFSDKRNVIRQFNRQIEELQTQLEDFKKELTTSSRRLSLNEVVELALSNNPTLKAAVDQVQSSEWLLAASRQTWYPRISINSSKLPSYGHDATYSYGGQVLDKSSISALDAALSAELEWTFIDPQRQPNINASYFQATSDRLLFYTVARETISNTQIQYYNLQGSIENIRDFQSIVEAILQSYNTISNKYISGYANILEVEQIRSQLEAELTNLIGAYITYSTNAAELSAYVGLPSFTIVVPSQHLSKGQGWTNPLKKSIELGLTNNELIKQALSQADVNKWRGFLEQNTYLPQFSFSINSEVTQRSLRESSWGNLGKRYNTQNSRNYGFLGFRWQLFNGGINSSNANSYFALQRKFKESAREQRDLVVSNIRSNFAQMFGYSKSIKSTIRSFNSAQAANDAAIVRYNAGFDDVTTIVQTVQQLSRSSIEKTRSVVEYNTALSNLYRYTATWPSNTFSMVERILSQKQSR